MASRQLQEKAHVADYTMLAWQMAYHKVHYPDEFRKPISTYDTKLQIDNKDIKEEDNNVEEKRIHEYEIIEI